MSDGSTGLGEHEAWYLDDVAHRLRRVPAAHRSPMLAVLEDNLGERPPSASRPELLEALGAPADYAERLRDAGGFRARPPRRPRSAAGRAALVLAGAAVIGGSWFGWRWWTDEVEIYNSCGGVWSPDPGVTVERKEAAGASESVVSYVDGAEVGLGTCLSADDEVELRDVRLEAPLHSLFRPTGLAMRSHAEPIESERPFQPFTLTKSGDAGMLFVTVEGHLEACEEYGEGTGISFDEVTVTYDYHGRRRTTAVDLGIQYTFVSPPDAECPRPRESGD